MRSAAKLGLLGASLLVALGFAACGGSGAIRVYVEPTYEQGRLQRLLGLHPEVIVLTHPGTEEVLVRVEAVPEERSAGLPRATIRAREPRSGYEVYAVAEFLRVRNARGGRARWVSSFADEIREDDVDWILFEVVREAARQQHRDTWRPPAEVERALHATIPVS
ncbi:MAG: hypothetical protein HY656_03035 [Acidobacteria bacterium]|nr:hypothetical protein [Acidobacteriota bacterium]